MRSYYPGELPLRFGLVRVRSPLLTESIFLSLPPGTEMFQFPGLARVFPDQSPFDGSPELFAVCHALEPPGAKTSPTRPYELGRTTPLPRPTIANTQACVDPETNGRAWLCSQLSRSSFLPRPVYLSLDVPRSTCSEACRKDATRITTLSKIAAKPFRGFALSLAGGVHYSATSDRQRCGVEKRGIEPLTSCLQSRRSTS